MGEMKVYIPDEVDARFRKTAMSVYGYGRGSISKAATEAFSKWCTEREAGLTLERESRPFEQPTESSTLISKPDSLDGKTGQKTHASVA